jgi:hypothetical protein
VTLPGLQVFLGLVARLEKGKHDMSFGATALDLANRIVFLSVGKCRCFLHACLASRIVLLSVGKCCCFVHACCASCRCAQLLVCATGVISACADRPGGALIGYAFGVATRWLLKWLQNHGAKPPQVHTHDICLHE